MRSLLWLLNKRRWTLISFYENHHLFITTSWKFILIYPVQLCLMKTRICTKYHRHSTASVVPYNSLCSQHAAVTTEQKQSFIGFSLTNSLCGASVAVSRTVHLLVFSLTKKWFWKSPRKSVPLYFHSGYTVKLYILPMYLDKLCLYDLCSLYSTMFYCCIMLFSSDV